MKKPKYLVIVCVLSCIWLFAIPNYIPRGSSVHGDSLGKNTGVGCHSRLQGIFPIRGSNPGLLRCRWTLNHLSLQTSPPYGYLHLILSSTYDLDRKCQIEEKFNILNHSWLLTIYVGTTESHGHKSFRWVNQVYIWQWWKCFHVQNEGHYSKSGNKIQIFLIQLKSIFLPRSLS